MRVCARQVDYAGCPEHVRPFANPEQALVTVGQEYEVHAVASFDGVLMLQVVDDLGYPGWKPAWLFEVRERALPDDWICSVFADEPSLVMGPEFIARDQDSYSRMVELDSEQVDRFWQRVDAKDAE